MNANELTLAAADAIVERVRADRVTMLDQSPHQLARATSRAALSGCARVLGDAELKKRLAEKGSARARDFEAKSIADRYGELFLRVANGSASRAGAPPVRGAAL